MSYIDDQRNRMNASGSDYTSYFKNLMQHKVNESFAMASDVYTIQMENSTGTYDDITVRVTTALSKMMSARTVVVHDDYRKIIFQDLNQVINLGQRFQFAGYYWITIDTANVTSITQSCVVKRCNNMLRWYDYQHVYHEVPCIAEDTLVDIRNDQYMMLPQGKLRSVVKYEDVAKLIKLDPITRFILNGQAYKVASLDHVSQVKNGVGWSSIMLDLDQISPYDDVVNGIADKNKPDNVHNYAISIVNGTSVSLTSGSTLQLNVNVTDNGNPVTSPTLSYTSSNPSVATVSSTGLITSVGNGNCTITVAMTDNPSTTATVSVNVVASVANNYSISISGSQNIKLNQSQNYTETVMNNGVIDNTKSVVWSLYDDTKSSPTTLATITSNNGSSCTIKNNNVSSGFVQLKAILSTDNTVIGWYRIQMTPLW